MTKDTTPTIWTINTEWQKNVTTQLYAKIKRTSKYYGQTSPGELFPVVIDADEAKWEYIVIGGPGGRYRLSDVNLFICGETGREVRLS